MAKHRRQLNQTRGSAGGPGAELPDIIATDSEWDTSLEDPWLSTAFASKYGTIVFLRADLPDEVRGQLDQEGRRLGVRLVYTDRTDATDLLGQGLQFPELRVRRRQGKIRLV